MTFSRLTRFITVSAMALCAGAAQAQDAFDDTADNGAAILVLDASGSMWGKVDAKHKIEIARDVVAETISKWDSGTDLGLIAYGHNKKGDCGDIETLISPGPVDADTFNAQTKALNPKGKTPLTAAVLKAAEALKYREARATVILVSDGKETCNLDPCAIGRQLEETGVDFTAHIIGFDVPEEDIAGLQCLATETGGMFIEASDTDELLDAMTETREMTTDKTPPVLSEATVAVPSVVPAGSEFEAKWTGPANHRDYLIVRSPDRSTRYDLTFVRSNDFKSPTRLYAPEKPGEYTAFYEVNNNTPLGSATFKVVPVTAALSFPDKVPAGSEISVDWTGPMNDRDSLRIFSADGDKQYDLDFAYRADHKPAKLRAPDDIGTYEMRFVTRGGKVLASQTFEVTEVAAKMTAPETAPAGKVLDVEWTGPMNERDSIRLFSMDGKTQYDLEFAYLPRHNPAQIRLPDEIGTYELQFLTQHKKLLARRTITTTPVTATIAFKDTVMAGDKFTVNWTGPMHDRDRVRVMSTDGTRKYDLDFAYSERHKPAKLKAPNEPGTYLVQFQTYGGAVLASKPLTVK